VEDSMKTIDKNKSREYLIEYFNALRDRMLELYDSYISAYAESQLYGNVIAYIYYIYGGKIKIPHDIYEQCAKDLGTVFKLNVNLDKVENDEHYLTIELIEKDKDL